jgi:hypothetical protein
LRIRPPFSQGQSFRTKRRFGLEGRPGHLGMTSQGDGVPLPPTLPAESQDVSLNIPKRRQQEIPGPHLDPVSQNKPINALGGTTMAPMTSLPTSRSSSPGTQPTRTSLWRNGMSYTGSGTAASSIIDQHLSEDTRDTIFRSFAPHVAVYASEEAEELVTGKGISGGLLSLLRPFGETVQGKVITRDSIGASKSWEDFGIHFVGLGDGIPRPRSSIQGENPSKGLGLAFPNHGRRPFASRIGGNIGEVEGLVRQHLISAESSEFATEAENGTSNTFHTAEGISTSSYFSLYLRRMLSGIPNSPHETFSHPVGCILAISSRNKTPIETLRHLYENTTHGDKRLPIWMNNEYLRYYVLIHDEENHDISKSSILFEQMKRHFGLNCHLLRLRTTRGIPTDDDVTPLPDCEWLTAAEEVQRMHDRGKRVSHL